LRAKCRSFFFRNIEQTKNEIVISVADDGIGSDEVFEKGNGLLGMKERLEFVNGTLEMISDNGMTLIIKVPTVVMQTEKEDVK